MSELILLLSIVCLLLCLLVMELIRTRKAALQARQHQERVHHLQEDIQALCAGAVNLGKHIAAMDQRLRRLNERQDQLEVRDPVQQSYGHAIRLAQNGADLDELISNCGLARGEAELLLRLHGAQKH